MSATHTQTTSPLSPAAAPVQAAHPGASATRIRGADAIRALACLWVFFAHAAMHMPAGVRPGGMFRSFLAAGYLGVGMFFVLSGFLLSQPFWKAHHAGLRMPSLRQYALRRLARIVPGYWACVFITAALYGAYQTRWDQFALGTTLAFANTFFAATFLPRFDGPLWSVSVEMCFYVMLPVLAWGMFLFRRRAAVTAYLLSVIVALAAGQYLLLAAAPRLEAWIGDPAFFTIQGAAWAVRRNALSLFSHFLIGVLAADLLVRGAARQKAGAAPLLPPIVCDLICAAIGVLIVVTTLRESWALPALDYMEFTWPTFHLLIAALLVLLPMTRALGRLLDGPFLRYTALISFGMYLWHWPIFEGLERVWRFDRQHPVFTGLAFTAVALALTYAVASASYFLIERPVLRWAHHREAPTRPAGP